MKINFLNSGIVHKTPEIGIEHSVTPKISEAPASQLDSLFKKYEFSPSSRELAGINDFLASGGDRDLKLKTVEVTIHKGIEPSKENLDMIHSALNDIPAPEEVMIQPEPMESDKAEYLKLPPEVRERIRAEMAKGRGFEDALRNVYKAVTRTGAPRSIHKVLKFFSDLEGALTNQPPIITEGGLPDAANILDSPMPINFSFGKTQQSEDKSNFILSGLSDLSDFPDLPNIADLADIPNLPNKNAAVFKSAAAGKSSLPGDAADSAGGDMDAKAQPLQQPPQDQPPQEQPPQDSRVQGQLPQEGRVRGQLQHEGGVQGQLQQESRAQAPITQQEKAKNIEEAVILAVEHIAASLGSLVADEIEMDYSTYLVEKTNEMTNTAATEFAKFKTEALNNLEKPNPQSLEKTIHSLRSAINKKSFALFTDMKTERKLMGFISELEKAQTLYKNGDAKLARKIADSVQKALANIEFKPASSRVQRFAAYKMKEIEGRLRDQPISMEEYIKDAVGMFSNKTARDMLELVRFTGVNHDIERAENTAASGDIKNIKEILTQMGGENPTTEMTTGQQMMNDSSGRGREFYSFNIPVEIGGEIEGLKVNLSGRSQDNSLDWKNVDIYFGIDLKQHGGLGIRFSAKNAMATTEILSDNPKLQSLQAAVKSALAGMPEIGYEISSVKFSARKSAEAAQPAKKTAKTIKTAKTAGTVLHEGRVDIVV